VEFGEFYIAVDGIEFKNEVRAIQVGDFLWISGVNFDENLKTQLKKRSHFDPKNLEFKNT
jgi:hypothetical protein